MDENVQVDVGKVDENTSLPKKFAFDSLEAVRKKLLDLSGRNTLLNYKHPKAGCIRLIDELPDQIMEELREGKSFSFIPVPEPTEKELIEAGYIEIEAETGEKKTLGYPTAVEWAKYIGLSTNYDLPDKENHGEETKHQDTNLQTLMYAPELEARLRSIRSKADTAIEESGANVLFLALGFLEWFERRDSDVSKFAPLYTLPVNLERAKLDRNEGVYRYNITLKDDALLSNITLREKLANDFDLVLPAIEEDISPETYFDLVQETILRHQPRWRIRRQATLAMLNFTKQCMYQDLNPENWPSDSSIEDHPIIQQFFNSSENNAESESLTFASEHPIDHIEEIHEHFPLVFDADSSQHSALIDAVKGENLVIEGPPGSGKSQTITNLIAASIANGKKVLFVAEKMAALNVVKNRLNKAGLGDFCFELHSHKTNKQKILQDLTSRINNQNNYTNPSSINADIERLEDLRHKLHNYVEIVNTKWRNTGLTIHEILNKATRYREQLSINPDNLSIDEISGENLTLVKTKEYLDQADMLGHVYDQVSEQASEGDIHNHYWCGINNVDLMGYQADSLIDSLNKWNNALSELSKYWERTAKELNFESDQDPKIQAIENICAIIESLPPLNGGELFEYISYMYDNKDQIDEYLCAYENIHKKYHEFDSVFHDNVLRDSNLLKEFIREINCLKALGIPENLNFVKLSLENEVLEKTIQKVCELRTQFDAISPNLPKELQGSFSTSISGISEFIKLIELMDGLSGDLWRYRDQIYDNPDLDDVLGNLSNYIKELKPLHDSLIDNFSLHRLPPVAELRSIAEILDEGGIFSFFSSKWRQARKTIFSLSSSSKPDKKQLLSLLPDLIKFAGGKADMDKLVQENGFINELYNGVETPIDRIICLRQWYKDVRKEYGIGFGDRVPIGQALLNIDRNLTIGILDASKQKLSYLADEIISSIKKLEELFPEFQPLFKTEDDLSLDNSSLVQLNNALSSSLESVSDVIESNTLSVEKLSTKAGILQSLHNEVEKWKNSYVATSPLHKEAGLSIYPGEFSERKLASLRNALDMSKLISPVSELANSIAAKPDHQRYAQILEIHEELKLLLSNSNDASNNFIDLGKVNTQEWFASSNGQLTSLIEKNNTALDNPNWLNTWLDYVRIKNKLSSKGLSKIINKLEENSINSKELRNVVELVVNHQLANEILAEHEYLSLFSGMEQMAIRKKYQEYDRNLLDLQRQKIAFKASRTQPPAGIATGRVSNYSETALIKHEAGKKSRHIAVRSLLKRSANAIQALKPCFMMSPMSVAQYLEPGIFNFDMVVMDEASQIRPEDALGAIARGTTLIVVGDPKQLPPTSFFQKTSNNDDDTDAVALEESESILESVTPMFKNRRLRWHYRSRHESLISFSNHHFYDSNLILFPSPFQETEEFGIRFSRVNKGRFVNRRNVEEAREVVNSTAVQLISNPEESVGIVAMSSEQRDEIDRQLEQMVKDDAILRNAYETNQSSDEPLFIKNLENVQGDERDVIIISMTYGPEQVGGRPMQRFGPINYDMGWRRLNVLFTRSKKRMHVFSSMDSGDVIVSENSKKGVKSLRAFLEYCETGHLHNIQHTGKASDSDFEIAVIQALSEHGYECEPQLGVAGYFLDIAVKDPGKPGRFLMGIECDGATYHSAKSTRDRDRLRQDILEGLGWKIRRIWSTDWFKNPQAQLQPILQELDRLKSEVVDEQADKDNSYQNVFNLSDKEPYLDESQRTVKNHDKKVVAPPANSNELTLKDRLVHFKTDILQKDNPNTSEDHGILRPAMLEAILAHQPCSKAEFLECIPLYLREGTAKEEGKYLDQILELVADYG